MLSSIFHYGQISKFKKGVTPRKKLDLVTLTLEFDQFESFWFHGSKSFQSFDISSDKILMETNISDHTSFILNLTYFLKTLHNLKLGITLLITFE